MWKMFVTAAIAMWALGQQGIASDTLQQRIIKKEDVVATSIADVSEIVSRSERRDGFVENFLGITAIRISKDSYSLAIIRTENGQSVAAVAADLAKNGEANFVIMNGGFLRSYQPVEPAGFLKIGGTIENTPIDDKKDPILSAVLCSNVSGILIRQSPSPDKYDQYFSNNNNCIQIGPLLLLQKQSVQIEQIHHNPTVARFSLERYSRSFVSLDRNGTLILGISGPATLTEIVTILQMDEARGGISASDLVNLQGSGGAAVMAYEGGKPVYSRGGVTTPQATVLVVKNR